MLIRRNRHFESVWSDPSCVGEDWFSEDTVHRVQREMDSIDTVLANVDELCGVELDPEEQGQPHGLGTLLAHYLPRRQR